MVEDVMDFIVEEAANAGITNVTIEGITISGEGDDETVADPVKPTFVNGVTVALYNGTTEIGTEMVNVDDTSEITITSTDDLVTIFENGTGTLDLTVKAKSPSQTPAE